MNFENQGVSKDLKRLINKESNQTEQNHDKAQSIQLLFSLLCSRAKIQMIQICLGPSGNQSIQEFYLSLRLTY